ncbi:MAG: glycosyltransferase family 2 protein [Methylomicrobium sp.]|nr:glycosyltransferase family 2 protein [Methylomicrobium sp.]
MSSNSSLKTVQVTVIIVNWNCNDVLSKCVAHLRYQTVSPRRILIMDNGSNDGSLQSIGHFDVAVCLLGENLGFAAANNRGLTECSTEFVALLNPDAFPEPDWLERLLDAANTHPDVSAFASLQLCDEQPEFIDGAGDGYHVSGLVWRNRHGTRLSPADQKNQSIFSPCAAAALYRRQALIDVGGFDEDYFCYVEDVDLGFRLRLAGHQAMYVHDAVVRHVGSVSTGGQHSDFCVYHGHRNLVWTYIKNMPGLLFWLLLPAHLLINFISIGHFARKGQGSVILRAKFDALTGIPKMWRKRRSIQNNRVATIYDIWQVIDKRLLLSSKMRKTE